MGLRSFSASAVGLAFMLAGSQTAEIVTTTDSGELLRRIVPPISSVASLTRHAGFNEIRTDYSGHGAILQGLRSEVHLLRFDPNWLLLSDTSLPDNITDVAFLDDDLVGWDQKHSTLVNLSTHTPIYSVDSLDSASIQFPPSLFVLDDDRIGLLESQIPQMTIISRSKDKRVVKSPIKLVAPEIQGQVHASPPGMVEIIAHHPVVGTTGHVFMAINPYTVDVGATILEFSDSGALINRYRCVLPMVTNPKTGKPIQMIPSFIGIAGHKLFIASNLGSKCAVYTLPS